MKKKRLIFIGTIFLCFSLFITFSITLSCSGSREEKHLEVDYTISDVEKPECCASPMKEITQNADGDVDTADTYIAEKKEKRGGKGEGETGIKIAKKLALSDKLKKKAPQLLSRYKNYQLDPLPFVSYDIYVVVAGHRARIIYDMVFENPTKTIQAGTLMIEPLMVHLHAM